MATSLTPKEDLLARLRSYQTALNISSKRPTLRRSPENYYEYRDASKAIQRAFRSVADGNDTASRLTDQAHNSVVCALLSRKWSRIPPKKETAAPFNERILESFRRALSALAEEKIAPGERRSAYKEYMRASAAIEAAWAYVSSGNSSKKLMKSAQETLQAVSTKEPWTKISKTTAETPSATPSPTFLARLLQALRIRLENEAEVKTPKEAEKASYSHYAKISELLSAADNALRESNPDARELLTRAENLLDLAEKDFSWARS